MTYAQYCPLAYALDLVGQKGGLLIVRDLGLGARRFSDLQRGLPSLSPNTLSKRLDELQDAGIVNVRRLPAPVNAAVYELTESGEELGRAIAPLASWGLRYLPNDVPEAKQGDHVGTIPTLRALQLMHRPQSHHLTIAIAMEVDAFTLESGDVLNVGPYRTDGVDAHVVTDPNTLLKIVRRQLDFADAAERITTDNEGVVRTFLEAFPSREEGQHMGRVTHFEVYADDPARAIKFYEAVLGWTCSRWGDVDYWLATTGTTDEAGINGAILPRDHAVGGDSVIAFVCTADVTDLDDTLERAVAAGGQVSGPKRAVPGIGWHAYIKDTEGNILGLMQNDEDAA